MERFKHVDIEKMIGSGRSTRIHLAIDTHNGSVEVVTTHEISRREPLDYNSMRKAKRSFEVLADLGEIASIEDLEKGKGFDAKKDAKEGLVTCRVAVGSIIITPADISKMKGMNTKEKGRYLDTILY